MLKILSSRQIREWDAYTIIQEPIASIDLMERASKAFVRWFADRFNISGRVGIICGTGNNGGDGLAIARLLKQENYNVSVWIVRGGKESDDFKANSERLGKMKLSEITSSVDPVLFADCDILIDALFGSGLSRSAVGIYAQVIDCLNQAAALRIAVDIPSGLMADHSSTGRIVLADHTVSFQLPKLAFLLPENQAYVGEWHLVDIGLDNTFIYEQETPYYYLTRESVKKILKPRFKFSNKGDHGKALLIAGSYGKMGACILSAKSVLRSGIGLLTLHVPRQGYAIVQTSVPEAMVSIDEHDQFFSTLPSLEVYTAIGIGPGLGQQKESVEAFKKLLQAGKPLVIDADALNMLSTHRELLHLIAPGSILTPHPKEFERLVGKWGNDFDRLEKQRQLAREIKSVIIVKGAHTSITTADGKVYFNSTGNPGMATGGSGDVLTGILTSLLAQNYSSLEAAILGVYIHGMAGDLAAAEKTMYAMMASDIFECLPAAFKELTR